MKQQLQLVLDCLLRLQGCRPKIVNENANSIYVPAGVAIAILSELTDLDVKVASIEVWEYEHMADPPSKWGMGGPSDDDGNGAFRECVDLGWGLDARELSESTKVVNGAAAEYLASLSDTAAYRAIGGARFYVSLFLQFAQPV